MFRLRLRPSIPPTLGHGAASLQLALKNKILKLWCGSCHTCQTGSTGPATYRERQITFVGYSPFVRDRPVITTPFG